MTKKPQNHKVRCACPICKNVRRIERQEAHSLKDLYEARRNGRLSIWGTTLGAYSAFWEWLLIRLLWKTVGREIIKSYAVVNLYKVHIADGYALVGLSPFVLIWWAFVSGLIIAISVVIGGLFILFATFVVAISALYIPISIYSPLELIASVVNRDWGRMNWRKYRQQREWCKNKSKGIRPIHYLISWIIWVAIYITSNVLVSIHFGFGWWTLSYWICGVITVIFVYICAKLHK